ncbi:hypothetical protein JW960_21725 [candidate division KSB1 bacterium]|nr:hypothetical protein [candidate division KSB1 bacterium]
MNKSTGILFKIISLSVVTVFLVSAMLWMGCQRTVPTSAPEPESAQPVTTLSKANPLIQAVMRVQDLHTAELMSYPDIIGTATGLTPEGTPAILVFSKSKLDIVTKKAELEKGQPLPSSIERIPVIVEYTGVIRPFKKPAPSTSHTGIQTPPIQLGTSGGWRYDLANGYCCGGTLGSLIQIGGSKYILSNYHVFEADIVSGGNNKTATTGDYIIQPGLIDVNCNAANAQNVATLVVKSSIPFNSNVDAAIAQIMPGMVQTDGSILEIGTISSSTVSAYIGQAVKKSGRTTGLTRSTVSALNATISVAYEDECAGGDAFTKTYTGQIVIANKRSKFLAGGDSGSLMVEDVATNPHAIGLLFAGSTSTAIANPIDEVLDFMGATMVGQ